jgi:hypothetical protein
LDALVAGFLAKVLPEAEVLAEVFLVDFVEVLGLLSCAEGFASAGAIEDSLCAGAGFAAGLVWESGADCGRAFAAGSSKPKPQAAAATSIHHFIEPDRNSFIFREATLLPQTRRFVIPSEARDPGSGRSLCSG